MNNRTDNAIRNVGFGVLNKIISIILPFITRTIFIYLLGKEILGLNSVFISILQVLSFAELGLGTAIVYSMYKSIAENDINTTCKLLFFYKKCYKSIGGLIFLLGIIICPFLKVIINTEISINIYFGYFIYLLNTVLSYFLYSYKSSLLIANQRNDIISKINLVVVIIQNLIQIIVLLIFENYYMYIIIMPIITICNNLMIAYYTKKMYPNIIPNSTKIEKEEYQKLITNLKGLIFQKLGNIILTNVDNIVISVFLGLSILGVYNNYYYIVTSLFAILYIITDVLKPSVGNSIILETKEKNYKDFTKFNFLYYWIITWVTVCFVCLVQDFISLWIGEEYLLSNVNVYLMALYLFVNKWCDMLFVYQEAIGLWWHNRYTQIIGAFINLSLNIILVNIIGLAGILISTIISVLFVLDIGYSKVLFEKYFSMNKYKKYIGKQFKYFIYSIIVVAISYIIISYITISNLLLRLIIKAVICIIIPNIIFVLLYYHDTQYKEVVLFLKEGILKRYINGKKNN